MAVNEGTFGNVSFGDAEEVGFDEYLDEKNLNKGGDLFTLCNDEHQLLQ